MPYVTTSDNTRLYVKEWGAGPPVILIHGWPLNADSWDDIGFGLAEAGFHAIAYDRRGFGRSDQPVGGYEYDTLADDLATVIEKTESKNAALVGFSMGGGEVARYLGKHGGSNISHAVLISSVVPFMLKTADNPKGTDQSVFDGMLDGIRKDRGDFMQSFAKTFCGVGIMSKPVSQAVLDTFFIWAMQAGLSPTLACVRAFAATDFRADTAAFTVPTLILHGTGDHVVSIDGSAREAARLIPHARLIEYNGAPHATLATHKDEVIRDLTDFLRGGQLSEEQDIRRAAAIDPMLGGLQPTI
ncbi:alpha/beta hydrolase [Sphingomonas paeninsulae]|uniref:Alpha/beta hydrolase n=1 Tax=Sphingomonas paeninsulae TaxID=2319844 RepID=A0A494TDI1_SPHPE|nr:alpha/beta hydrolase [Sphingomonas paeninsulae]AYJ87579.1 alpha/beta hydrolase [Sphingomonas paeninsulae]